MLRKMRFRPGALVRSLGDETGPGAANLVRVVMRVRRVRLEPVLDAVAANLGVRPGALPLLLGEAAQDG